jgi:hypothetical protein
MTEDEVVQSLCSWLKSKGWQIKSYCIGRQRGNDIEAVRKRETLIVEAKGTKGKLSNTTRPKFDSGQVETHLGKAIVKVLEQKAFNPKATIAIAHPYNEYLMQVMQTIRPELKKAGIKLYWVKSEQEVLEE